MVAIGSQNLPQRPQIRVYDAQILEKHKLKRICVKLLTEEGDKNRIQIVL